MQALWHLALEPVAEQVADFNAYGFRPKRSTSDAIEQCFIALSTKVSAQWVFEGDIYACFDKISHDWLLKNIPMDKQILGKFLKAGFIEKKVMHPTKHGIPQGGIIAPTLTVIALSGLEKKLKSRFPKNRKVASKVNMVSYADDFIITGVSKAILEESVIPIVEEHLRERGLSLSQAKSRITHIKEGFDFLGFCIRKYNDKLLIKPAKANVKKFLKEIKELIKHKRALKTEDIITTLNPKVRGWCNYYRSVVSSRTFSYVDNAIFWALYSWACRRHPHRGKRWIYAKYYCTKSVRKWRFHAKAKDKEGNNKTLYLYIASTTKTIKHIKTRYNANPYHPEFIEYFKLRDERVKKRQEKRQLVQ